MISTYKIFLSVSQLRRKFFIHNTIFKFRSQTQTNRAYRFRFQFFPIFITHLLWLFLLQYFLKSLLYQNIIYHTLSDVKITLPVKTLDLLKFYSRHRLDFFSFKSSTSSLVPLVGKNTNIPKARHKNKLKRK